MSSMPPAAWAQHKDLPLRTYNVLPVRQPIQRRGRGGLGVDRGKANEGGIRPPGVVEIFVRRNYECSIFVPGNTPRVCCSAPPPTERETSKCAEVDGPQKSTTPAPRGLRYFSDRRLREGAGFPDDGGALRPPHGRGHPAGLGAPTGELPPTPRQAERKSVVPPPHRRRGRRFFSHTTAQTKGLRRFGTPKLAAWSMFHWVIGTHSFVCLFIASKETKG